MDGSCLAPAAAWAQAHFADAGLPDQRLDRRLLKLATAMALKPGESLPQQCQNRRDLRAAYALLNHPRIRPDDLQRPHRRHSLQQCRSHPVVLAVHDDSNLDFTRRRKVRDLGLLGDGRGRGIVQHSTLAVLPAGEILGLLDQRFFNRQPLPQGETRRQRQRRWRESEVWADAIRATARLRQGQEGPRPRLIHVADRGGDDWDTIQAALDAGDGFLIRLKHNRMQSDGRRVREAMARRPAEKRYWLHIPRRKDTLGRVRRARWALVTLRYGPLTLRPPVNDPTCQGDAPVACWGVWVVEENPPTGRHLQAVDWMLLCSERVADQESALRTVGWYSRRWTVEEFHRVEKEGCGIERSQLDNAADLRRLAAIQSVHAVRLLQLRDLADLAPRPPVRLKEFNEDQPVEVKPDGAGKADQGEGAGEASRAHDPKALQQEIAPLWIQVVSRLARVSESQLTPRQFWLTIAQRGGYLNRTCDRRPGWKVIWRGWREVLRMVEGIELMNLSPATELP